MNGLSMNGLLHSILALLRIFLVYEYSQVKSSLKLTGRLNYNVLAPILNSWVMNSDKPSLVQVFTLKTPN